MRAMRGRLKGINDHLQLSSRGRGNFVHPRHDGIAPAADAAHGIGPRGKRVARLACNQRFHKLAHAGLVDVRMRNGVIWHRHNRGNRVRIRRLCGVQRAIALRRAEKRAYGQRKKQNRGPAQFREK
ncbi:MAG: hypothetical protein ABSF78_15250 [Candidatus Acidiferrales bacterium]